MWPRLLAVVGVGALPMDVLFPWSAGRETVLPVFSCQSSYLISSCLNSDGFRFCFFFNQAVEATALSSPFS